jgi:OFA family oxalate/formate antiporter-like MFS transporter
MNRGWSVVAAGLGINLALGILYTWSVISKAIPADWGWTETDKSLPYSICCLVFSLMMVPAGRLQDKISPRLVATMGGILVGIGMILASRGTSSFAYVIGFGVLAGTGIGFGYASATPPAVKWFPPAKTGMIAGLVVSGFGLAPAYAAPLTRWLVGLEGGVPQALLVLGVAFLIVVIVLAQLLRIPPAGYTPPGMAPAKAAGATHKVDFSPSEMLGTNQFYLLWFMYACGAGAGLMIIAKLATIGSEQAGLKESAMLVAYMALGNGAGRIVAGTLSDRLGRKPTIVGCLLIQSVLMIVLTRATAGSVLATFPVLAFISALIGANYGANLALYPSVTKDYYGLKNFGVNYGLVFTAWGIGGLLLPLLAGRLRDVSGKWDVACFVASGLLILAAVIAAFLRAPQPVPQSVPQQSEN